MTLWALNSSHIMSMTYRKKFSSKNLCRKCNNDNQMKQPKSFKNPEVKFDHHSRNLKPVSIRIQTMYLTGLTEIAI